MTMKRYDVRGAAFTRLGRFNPDENGCALWWSGSGVRVKLACTRIELEATVADDENLPMLAVTVDGAPVARFALRPGTHRYDLLGRMDAGETHEIAVLRDSQPTDQDTAPLYLDAVYTDGEPAAPEYRPLLIEFLGDSLTVGEGTVGPHALMAWRMLWCCNQFAFPTLVAESLKADKRLVALGGWGAYLSWDAIPSHTIGTIYDDLCGVSPAGAVPYDFAAQRRADAVVINLGTNDCGAIEKLAGAEKEEALEKLVECAVKLMETARRHNPDAAILWAYGLCGNGLEAPLRRAVEARNAAGDENVRYLALSDCNGEVGSQNHPGRAAHRRAAEEIAGALRQMMK